MTHKFEIYASNDSTSRLDFIGEVQATDYRNAIEVATKKFGEYAEMDADIEKWDKVKIARQLGCEMFFCNDAYEELQRATTFLYSKGIIG